MESKQLESVVIRFAGDSGDGMQLTGSQFTATTALFGNDVATFPDFPAEIRAPLGTLPGVSGFQVHFGSNELFTPGDTCDVLVAMNAAALKTNIRKLKPNGIIIANTDGFDNKNLRLANIPEADNPLRNGSLSAFEVYEIDITKLTKNALAGSGLGTKETERCKNMFVLGLIYWMYNRTLDFTIDFIKRKFDKQEAIALANIKALQAGFNFGDTTEVFNARFNVAPAKLKPGVYRSITGNEAVAYGLIAASVKSGLPLFLGSYPITPASDILHELSKHKQFGVYTFQAEDEIAGICAAIGASYGGSIGVTTSSGPGIALKAEAIGLATMLELPLVICNIQRGGPSTGLPTKTEQADLLQAFYGRNGECPVAIVSAATPSDCFNMVYEAVRIAWEHTVPVFFLSDGYLANGAEPWKFPKTEDLKPINITFAQGNNSLDGSKFYPYVRDEKLARSLAKPGTPHLEHRVGGIEKEMVTGNISYDPANHEAMVKLRAEKIQRIEDYIPEQTIEAGEASGKLLVIGWGSTYGAIKTAVSECLSEGLSVSQIHLRYLNPFPKNLGSLLKNFEHVLVPEMNNGQLVKLLRDRFLTDAKGLNKIQGQPFSVEEIKRAIKEYNR